MFRPAELRRTLAHTIALYAGVVAALAALLYPVARTISDTR
jgi:hypothetical protein